MQVSGAQVFQKVISDQATWEEHAADFFGAPRSRGRALPLAVWNHDQVAPAATMGRGGRGRNGAYVQPGLGAAARPAPATGPRHVPTREEIQAEVWDDVDLLLVMPCPLGLVPLDWLLYSLPCAIGLVLAG